MQDVPQVKRQAGFFWYLMHSPALDGSCLDGMFAGMRIGIDDSGAVWAYSGLLIDEKPALMLGALSGAEFVVYRGFKYMRLDWMRENLIASDDEQGHELASLVQTRADAIRGH